MTLIEFWSINIHASGFQLDKFFYKEKKDGFRLFTNVVP